MVVYWCLNKNTPNYDLPTYLYHMTFVDLTAIDGLEVLTV